MPLPSRQAASEGSPKAADTLQPSGPTAVSALAVSPAGSVASPALALQQQLVDRMSDILGSTENSATAISLGHEKWPMPVRLLTIAGLSMLLWLAIGTAVIQII